jgi:hypothetical protein
VFRVEVMDLGFLVESLGFGAQECFRFLSLGFRVLGFGFRVEGPVFRVLDFGFMA